MSARLATVDRNERRFRIYAYSLGFASTAFVAVQLYMARELVRQEFLPIASFSLLIGLAWFFSFSIFPRAHLSISLDMAYIMTAICVLEPPLPLAVACLGALSGVLLRTRDPKVRSQPFLPVLCLNTGGLVITVLAGQWLSIVMQP